MARWPNDRQKEVTFRRMGYKPNPAQRPLHSSGATVLQLVGAEGAGKSYVVTAEITACIPWSDLIYIVGQTYENTHSEFNYLVENLLALDTVELSQISRPKQGGWLLTTRTGCRVETLSVRDGTDAIIARGAQPDIIVLVEGGIIRDYSVLLASARRATRARGRVIMVGTLKDSYGWYAALSDELKVQGNPWLGETYSLPAWTNLMLYPGGRDDPEIKRLEEILPEDDFARTVAARRMPSKALVFPEFSYATHVRECVYDSFEPVFLWIDPGYYPAYYAVLAIQFHGDEVWQIDEIYIQHQTHREVIDLCIAQEWWGGVIGGVIDFAGRQHHAQKSAVEEWNGYGGVWLNSQRVGILDGISRHRDFLNPKRPRLFCDPKCVGTLGEYQKYRRPKRLDGTVMREMPLDQDNHSMKAIAYGLVWHFGFSDDGRQPIGDSPLSDYRG